jgi:hypothetical protein
MNISYLRRGIFRVLKQNKWIFYAFEWFKWHKEIDLQKAANDPATLKSREQIKREERLVRNYWHLGTFHYYRYGLQYRQLTDEQLLDYVPTYYFHKNIERHHQGIDTVKWGDKLVQARLFEERNIPTAKVIAVVKNGICWDLYEQKRLDIKQIINDCLSDASNKLFFKPTGGCGGAGILVLKRCNNQLLLNGEVVADADEFMSKLSSGTYVVEENIIQNAQLSAINPSSVNTLRVVVQEADDAMTIRTCILRMGRQGKEVDNSAQGGISLGVNVQNGEFALSATAEHGAGVIPQHPDTKYQFAGNGIHNWDGVKSQIEDIANQLRDFKDIALDIAITKDKVIIIEFNFRYGIEHQQCVLGGVRQILGIPNK